MKYEKDVMRHSVNTLKKLFTYLPKNIENNKIPTENLIGYMDVTCTIMLIPKTYYLKELITKDFDVKERNIPELKYNDIKPSGYYSTSLMHLISPLMKNTCGNGVKITCAEDMPIILETKEMKIIVAPRMFNGDIE